MAELELKKERNHSVWPWILGLLALLLIGWAAFQFIDPGDDEFVAATTEEQTAVPPPQPTPADALTRFEQECATGGAAGEADVDQCIGQMTAALTAVAQRDTAGAAAASAQLEAYRASADGLAQDTAVTDHAARVGEVFDDAAALIRGLEESRAGSAGAVTDVPTTHADRVQQAADAFDADLPLDGQREVVRTFFSEVATALHGVADRQG